MSSILNQDERQTPMREIGLIGVPVKAGVILLAVLPQLLMQQVLLFQSLLRQD